MYIFCVIALLIQPFFTWYVYHRQDKRKAALKLPMLFYSVVYLVVQFYVFIRFCSRFPEGYRVYSYLIQTAILLVFVLLELALFGSNRYIENVQQKEQASIREFKGLIRELEICKTGVSDGANQQQISKLLEKMRYSDPVSSPAVAQENEKIHALIEELSAITEPEAFAGTCDEIARQLEIRKIKNGKQQG